MSQLSTGQKDSIELWCNYQVDVHEDHQTVRSRTETGDIDYLCLSLVHLICVNRQLRSLL